MRPLSGGDNTDVTSVLRQTAVKVVEFRLPEEMSRAGLPLLKSRAGIRPWWRGSWSGQPRDPERESRSPADHGAGREETVRLRPRRVHKRNPTIGRGLTAGWSGLSIPSAGPRCPLSSVPCSSHFIGTIGLVAFVATADQTLWVSRRVALYLRYGAQW